MIVAIFKAAVFCAAKTGKTENNEG